VFFLVAIVVRFKVVIKQYRNLLEFVSTAFVARWFVWLAPE
jgi:hypothetical protein